MSDMTPLESLVQDELARAGKGEEGLAVTRCWRAIALRSLSQVLAGREQNHIGVLGVVIHGTELYGYTLQNASLASDGVVVRFARQGIADVMEYLDWCYAFFGQLCVSAADLPAPHSSTMNVESVARANALVLKGMLAQLRDESGKVEESEAAARAHGHDDAMGTVGISAETFKALGRALASIICAWFSPDERQQFMAHIKASSLELGELHDMVRMNVAEEADEEDATDEPAPEGAESGVKIPEK